MKVVDSTVVRGRARGKNQLSFEVELGRSEVWMEGSLLEDGLQVLLAECVGRIVGLQAKFRFFGHTHLMPLITLVQPSLASLSAALRAVVIDLPSKQFACFVRIYSVRKPCLNRFRSVIQ